MKKYVASVLSELITFISVVLLLWNFTNMDALEIIVIDLFIAYALGISTFMYIEERENKNAESKSTLIRNT